MELLLGGCETWMWSSFGKAEPDARTIVRDCWPYRYQIMVAS